VRRVPLTGSGWAAIGGGVALLVAAGVVGYVELSVAGVACLVALVLALAWVHGPLALDVDRAVDPLRVAVGDEARAQLVVTNTSGRASLPLAARDTIDRGWRGLTVTGVALPRLRGGASVAVGYPLPTDRRAVLRVGPLAVVRQDPFGLVRIEQVRGDALSAFVHPATVDLEPLPATFERSLDGPTTDTAPQGSQAFHQLREYVPGDDRRMIHWRSSARTGTLMVRQHVDTSLPDLTVVLDTRAERWGHPDDGGGGGDEPFEVAVSVAASLVVACAGRGFPVRLRTTDGQRWDAPFGQPAVTFFLDRLAGVAPADGAAAGAPDQLDALAGVARSLGGSAPGYAAVVVTGRSSPDDARSLAPLVGRFSTVTLVDTRPGGVPVAVPGVRRIDARTPAEFADRWNGRNRGAQATGSRRR
jgi:uncharacterized protein (DUF58 family)